MKHFTKKILVILLLVLPFITNAQLTEQWNITHSWNVGNNFRGIAYNDVNNHVYIAGCSSANVPEANQIIVLDGTTGDSITTLDLTGLAISANGFGIRDVAVSSDGGILAHCGTLNTYNPLKLYYWPSESEQAIKLWEYDNGGGVTSEDFGTGFSVSGDMSGDALILIPRQDAAEVWYLEVTDGVLDPNFKVISLAGISAGSSASAEALGTSISDGFWYNNSSLQEPSLIDGTGNVTGAIDGTLFTGTTGDVKQITAGSNTFLVVSNAGNVQVIDVTGAAADYSDVAITDFYQIDGIDAPHPTGWGYQAYGYGQEQAAVGLSNGDYVIFSFSGTNYIKMLAPSDAAPIATNIQVVGNPQEGVNLSASYTYIDFNNDPEGVSTYRWLNSDTPEGTYTEIAGATALTYTLAATDIGKYVKFEVTPVASSGTTLTGTAVLSSPSAQIVAASEAFPVASDVTFSGTLTSGQLLTATYTYSDSDGDLEGTSTYKWFTADDAAGTNAVEIAGATATTYTLTESEVGKHIAFEVTPVAATGSLLEGDPVLSSYSADPVISAPTAPVANDVAVSGTEEVGMVLTGSYTYFDANDDPEGASTYQWYTADDAIGTNQAAIAGATEITYTLTAAEEGKFVFFGVIPVQEDGTAGVEAFAVTVDAITPYNDQAPVAENVAVSGTPESEALLSASYVYSDYNLDPEGASIYQWYIADDAAGTNQTAITGADKRSYLVTDAETGKYFAVEVTPVAVSGTTTVGATVLSAFTADASIASTNLDGLERMWVGSQKYGALPWYLGTGTTERGFAVGADHVYVASRKDGNSILVIDKNDGFLISKMTTEGMTAGFFTLNDVEVSDDGQILACGLNLNASTSPFVVYKWTDESAAPVEWLSVQDAQLGRIGKFTVTGDVSTGIAVVMAVVQSSDKLVRWVITDGTPGAPEIITLANTTNLLAAAVPLSLAADADILVSAKGFTPTIFNSVGDSLTSIPHIDEYAVSGNQATSPNVFSYKGRTMAAFFQAQRIGAEKGARVIVADITAQPFQIVDSSEYIAIDDGWNGEVDVTVDGDYYNTYILETNLGLGRYRGEMVLPEFVSAETSLDGLTVKADFTKVINDASVTGNDFWTVLANGSEIAVTNITSSTDTITFELASAIAEGETVTIAYDGLGTVSSFDGMPLAAFGPEDVLNLVNAAAPEAQNVSVTGDMHVGETLTGTYTYYDANGDSEGVSTYKWYKADDDAGTNTNTILGETSATMTVTADLVGKYIAFEVTPVALTGGNDYLTGTPTISSWTGPLSNVGIDNIWGNNITIYPNPVTDNLFIRNTDNVQRITVTNIIGQNVIRIENNYSPEVKLNTQNLTNGIFIITFYNKEGYSVTSKFLKIN